MESYYIVTVGFVFGLLISYAGLNKYNTISGLSVLTNFTVAKTIMLVIGFGSVGLAFEMGAGVALFHLRPFYLLGTTLGGILFGIGMSLLGYCPGTLPISIGQGSLDALVGLIGGIFGGLFYTLSQRALEPYLGPMLGKGTLFSWLGSEFSFKYYAVLCLISAVMIAGAFYLNYLDRIVNQIKDYKWIVTGVGLAALNLILFAKEGFNRPLGASTSYPYVADMLFGATENSYFPLLVSSGNWQVKFLAGSFIAGLVYAVITRTFKVVLIHEGWKDYKGDNKEKRILWAFIGGFILIYGARMADGCTSGHIITGGMQYAASSFVFAIFTFIGFLSTGYLFYVRGVKKKANPDGMGI